MACHVFCFSGVIAGSTGAASGAGVAGARSGDTGDDCHGDDDDDCGGVGSSVVVAV